MARRCTGRTRRAKRSGHTTTTWPPGPPRRGLHRRGRLLLGRLRIWLGRAPGHAGRHRRSAHRPARREADHAGIRRRRDAHALRHLDRRRGLASAHTGPARCGRAVRHRDRLRRPDRTALRRRQVTARARDVPPVWFEREVPSALVAEVAAAVRMLGPATDDDPYAGLTTATAAVVSSGRCDAAFMDRAPGLRVIARTGVGYDRVDPAGATRPGG